MITDLAASIATLRQQAPWLCAPELQACLVGSAALAMACQARGVPGPRVVDLDIAWTLTPDQAVALLARHGSDATATPAARARGTVGATVAGQRIEFTTFRRDHGLAGTAAGKEPFFRGANVAESVAVDVRSRDMTIGALYYELGPGRVHDPMHGAEDWQHRLIRACGAFEDRVREHPVRLLRYFRRAAELGFELHPHIRHGATALTELCARETPPEALADEFRKVLLRSDSPGLFFLFLSEARALRGLFHELAAQFDGRPAGPARYHPELHQGLHLVLALKLAAERTRARNLPESDRLAVLLAVLCHDLGKGQSPPQFWPRHHGHEARGVHVVERFLDTMPSLADAACRRLVLAVAELHGVARELRQLKASTLVVLWEEWFRRNDFRPDLFALAVGCDLDGRLPPETIGLPAPAPSQIEQEIRETIARVHRLCLSVDAEAIKAECKGNMERFQALLHEHRVRMLKRMDFFYGQA